MTPNELRRLFPNASRATFEANSAVPDASPKRDKAKSLERPVQGKKESVARITLRFVGHRVRPLDPDSFAASTKDLIDGLIAAHLLPNDTIWDIALETTQTRVKSFAEQKTEIEIIYPRRKGKGPGK